MKKMKLLTSFNHYLSEIGFLKEILCGTRKKFCATSSEIGAPLRFCPRYGKVFLETTNPPYVRMQSRIC